MKSDNWKLALATIAGLIWLAILIRQNTPPSAPVESDQRTATRQANKLAITPGTRQTTPTLISLTQRSAHPSATPATPPTVRPVYHEVLPGEVPGVIAKKYGIDVETLMRINDISDPASLQIGQSLRIPVTVTPTNALTPRVPPAPSPTPQYHTVLEGEVLLSIAAEYDTSVEAIMIVNEIINPRGLQIGQKLLIPPDKGSILGVPSTIHEVADGDTLLALATRYGSTLDDILVSNPDLEPTSLQLGQKIVIPITHPRTDLASNPTLAGLRSPSWPSPELVALEQAILDAVNLQRQLQEISPYSADEELTTVARAHAQDMVARGFFSHVTPEGITLRDRIEASGLNLNWVGENIQRNTQPTNVAARYAVDWFMESPPHRGNILHERFNRIGMGVAEGPPGWYTFVLVFAGD